MNEPAELPPALTARYRVERPLSQGAFGWVLEATQLELGRRVALKLLHRERQEVEATVKRFRAEARLTASLAHPHIVQVLDHGVDDGVPWIAYELLTGGTLAERIDQGALPPGQALTIGAQLAGAVEVAHQAGVLHRDIKSQNVLAAPDGTYKLTDFGLAKWSGEHTILTAEGAMVGTPGYMAPELATGTEASPASDVYALGVLVFEMLTGARPFTGTSGLEVLQKHLKAPPPAPSSRQPGLSPEIDRAVLAALAKSPADRPASAAAFGAILEGLAGSKKPGPRSRPSRQARAVSTPPPAPPATGQGRQLALALGVALATCGLVATVGIRLLDPGPPANPPASVSLSPRPSAPSTTEASPSPRAEHPPATPSPAASRAALSDSLRHSIAAMLDSQHARRQAIRYSFGELVEKTADNDSFLGLSPDELAEQIARTKSQRASHLAMRDEAASILATVQRELTPPESARDQDLGALADLSIVHTIESIEVLRYDRLLVVLDHLSRRQKQSSDRLESTLQELKTLCYPQEVLGLLERHSELTGMVLARAAAAEHPDPLYPRALGYVYWLGQLFTSYTVCGSRPLEVVDRAERRTLAALARVPTPAGRSLARLVSAIWRARVGSTAAYARHRAEAHELIRQLKVSHPSAAAEYDRLARGIPQ